jgi:hypothetical protein
MRFGLLLGFLLISTASATDLTSANFDDLVLTGKGAFVKFLAPW